MKRTLLYTQFPLYQTLTCVCVHGVFCRSCTFPGCWFRHSVTEQLRPSALRERTQPDVQWRHLERQKQCQWAHERMLFFIQSVKWIIAAWIPVLISPHLYTFLCCRSFRPEAVCRPADQMCRAAWINTDRRQHCLLPSHQQEGGCW